MKAIRNVNKIGMCFGLIVFFSGGIKAWAVVPYPLSPELAKAEKAQADKQEIMKRIENIKTQDIKFVKEIKNELGQIIERNSEALPKAEPCGERH